MALANEALTIVVMVGTSSSKASFTIQVGMGSSEQLFVGDLATILCTSSSVARLKQCRDDSTGVDGISYFTCDRSGKSIRIFPILSAKKFAKRFASSASEECFGSFKSSL